METVTAGQAIVNILLAEGVRHVFGLPGGHVLEVYDGIYKTPKISHVLVRHEQCAASLAAGYAQLTGEPGVVAVTAGPGATNLVTPVAEAYVGALPMIIIAARTGTNLVHKGAAQDVDTTRLFAPITKWSVLISRAESIVDIVRQAFNVARSGKPGPVFLDIPRDFLAQQVSFGSYLPVGRPLPPRGNFKQVQAAAYALSRAERPILIAGGGAVASGANQAVRDLAERLAIPVLTSLAGRGIIADSHPLSVGGLGVHRNALSKRLLAEADCVLGLGTRFEEMETNWRAGFVPAPEATYIQVDIDAAEIGHSVVPKIGIVGDIRLVIEDLIAVIDADMKRDVVRRDSWTSHPRVQACTAEVARIEKELDVMADSDITPIHPIKVIRAARKVFPKETTVSIDVGVVAQLMAGGFPTFKVYEPRSLMVPSSFYGMGFASAALPVAKLVYPDRPALGFVGDGSFQMVMNILPVAVEHRLPVTWCILNDSALGSIRDAQEFAFKGRYLGTDFHVQPDFARLAEACGCYGEKVERPVDVLDALERAMAANMKGRPAVLDFIIARKRLGNAADFFPFYPKPDK